MALVLTRKLYQRVFIGNDIVVCVSRIDKDSVRLAFDAPASMVILREELREDANRDSKCTATKPGEGIG